MELITKFANKFNCLSFDSHRGWYTSRKRGDVAPQGDWVKYCTLRAVKHSRNTLDVWHILNTHRKWFCVYFWKNDANGARIQSWGSWFQRKVVPHDYCWYTVFQFLQVLLRLFKHRTSFLVWRSQAVWPLIISYVFISNHSTILARRFDDSLGLSYTQWKKQQYLWRVQCIRLRSWDMSWFCNSGE